MEEQDRRKILDNLTVLLEGISFDDLFNQLKTRGMFNSYMEQEILGVVEKKKLAFLYKYVTTRGPNAFSQLCEALKEIKHSDLAELLTKYRPSTIKVFRNDYSSNQLSLEEEYPYEQEWIVTKGDPVKDVFDYDLTKVYKMRSSPRGLALIINNYNFVNNTKDTREGSEKDVARLQSILPQLGYKVMVKEDLSSDEMLDELYKFSKDEEHKICDSAMVFIMSHGMDRQDGSHTVLIAGSDSRYVNSHDVINTFLASRCEALRGKPKLFFFQTCRGDNYNYTVLSLSQNEEKKENESTVAVELQNGHSDVAPEGNSLQTDGTKMGVRSDSDIFIGHATSPGMISVRDPDTGTWYIQTLCRVFARYAWHEDLYTMAQIVRQEKTRLGVTEVVIKAESNQGFNKSFYFHPGIRFDSSPIKITNGS